MRWVFVLVTLLLVVGAIGCGAGRPEPLAGADDINVDPVATKALRTYLYQNFGGASDPKLKASWYDLITNVEVTGDKVKTAQIATEIHPDKEGKQLAGRIAAAALWCSQVNIKTVEVLDRGGGVLKRQSKP